MMQVFLAEKPWSPAPSHEINATREREWRDAVASLPPNGTYHVRWAVLVMIDGIRPHPLQVFPGHGYDQRIVSTCKMYGAIATGIRGVGIAHLQWGMICDFPGVIARYDEFLRSVNEMVRKKTTPTLKVVK